MCLLTCMTMRENPVFLKIQGKQKRYQLWRKEQQVFFPSVSFSELLLLPITISTLPAPGLAVLRRLQCVTAQILCSIKTDGGSDHLINAQLLWGQPRYNNQWHNEDTAPNPLLGEGYVVICALAIQIISNFTATSATHTVKGIYVTGVSLSQSAQRMTEAKPVCSEAPKLQEQLQSCSQAAELGHRTGAFTLH